MKQVIELAALVEDLDDQVTTERTLKMALIGNQIVIEVGDWDARLEIPAEKLSQALAALAPTEPPVSLTLVQHLGQKLSRLEQDIAANPHQRLELEGFRESLEAFRREIIPRLVLVETWKARLESLEAVADQKGLDEGLSTVLLEDFDRRIKALEAIYHAYGERIAKLEQEDLDNDAAIVALEHTAQNFGDRIAVLENNLAEPPAETAALALYGGEQ